MSTTGPDTSSTGAKSTTESAAASGPVVRQAEEMAAVDKVVAAVMAALPIMTLEERLSLEQHARTLLRAPSHNRSRWSTRETLRIIAEDPGHPLAGPAAKTLARIAQDDRHRQ